jgi:hypothetical protein
VSLQGSDDLKKRLKALKLAFKPIGKAWADEGVVIGRPMLPIRPSSMKAGDGHAPGRLHDSLRRKSATQTKAVIAAHYTGYFIDAGVKPHHVGTIFSKKMHPGYKARPWRARMAHEALRRQPPLDQLVKQWNDAA